MQTAVAACAALLIAAGFACVGDLLLRRRSRGIFSLNESFLIGGAALASMLFPISLVAGAYTVDIVIVIIVSATGGWLAWHGTALPLSFRRGANSTTGALPRLRIRYSESSPLALLLLIVLLAYVLVFCALSVKHAIVSDGLHIWASKAVVLYHQGVTRQLWSDAGYESRVTGYPFLIPLYEALVGKFIGGFSFFVLNPLFILFEVSLLLSMYRASRAVAGHTIALLATLCLAVSPTFLDDTSLGGFADVPLAAMVGANMAAWLTLDPSELTLRSPIPWLVAGLLTVKTEGIVLFWVVILVAFATWIGSRSRGPVASVSPSWAALLLGALLLRLSYLSWLPVSDPTYLPLKTIYIHRALAFLPEILRLGWIEVAKTSAWGWLWPGFIGALAAVTVAGRVRERAIAGAAVLSLACYTFVYGFSIWRLSEHIPSSYSRLLTHLAPAAILTIACAYRIGAAGTIQRSTGPCRRDRTAI